MGLGIRINRPSFHLGPKAMNAAMDFRQGPIELQNMTQGKPSTKIRGGRRIGDVLAPNRSLNHRVFPQGFQIIGKISADKRIGRQSQYILRFRVSPLSFFYLNIFIQDTRDFQRLRHGIEQRKTCMNG